MRNPGLRVASALLAVVVTVMTDPSQAVADSTVSWYIDSVFPSSARGAGKLTLKCATSSDATWSYPFKHPLAQKTIQKDYGSHGEVISTEVPMKVNEAVRSIGCYVEFYPVGVGYLLDGIGSGRYVSGPAQRFRAVLRFIGR